MRTCLEGGGRTARRQIMISADPNKTNQQGGLGGGGGGVVVSHDLNISSNLIVRHTWFTIASLDK